MCPSVEGSISRYYVTGNYVIIEFDRRQSSSFAVRGFTRIVVIFRRLRDWWGNLGFITVSSVIVPTAIYFILFCVVLC